MPGEKFVAVAKRGLQSIAWLRKPELLVFLPAITLAGFWLGGERALILLGVVLKMVV